MARADTRWVRRAPHVLTRWRSGAHLVQAADAPTAVPATPLLLELLDRLGGWTTAAALASDLDLPADALAVLLDGLLAHGIVEAIDGAAPPPSDGAAAESAEVALEAWPPAASLFHHATRDVVFARRERTGTEFVPPRPPAELPPRGDVRIALPPPRVPGTFGAALRVRRTHRQFADAAVRLDELATLLGVTFGVQAWVQPDEGPLALKTSPSGGARHSLEAYVWARRVSGLVPGLYHYRPGDHALTSLDDGQAPASVTDWLPTQDGYEHAPVLVVLASVLARVTWRYRSARAYRVVLIEAGHLGQTFCLTAAALGLAPFCTAALADSAIERALALDGEEQPAMYVMGAGRVRHGPWQPHAGRPAPPLVVTPLGRRLEARLTRRWSGPRRRPRHGHTP